MHNQIESLKHSHEEEKQRLQQQIEQHKAASSTSSTNTSELEGLIHQKDAEIETLKAEVQVN